MLEIRVDGQGTRRLVRADVTGKGLKLTKRYRFDPAKPELFLQEGFSPSAVSDDTGKIDLKPGFEYRIRVRLPWFARMLWFSEGGSLLHLQYHKSSPLISHRLPLSSGDREFRIRIDPRTDACALGLVTHNNRAMSPIDVGYRLGPRVEPIPNFGIIIGAMKSGTTSLFGVLAHHPGICPNATAKEPNFFSSPANYSTDQTTYASQYNFDPSTHKIALEASPSYTKWPRYPDVPVRMKQYDARYKLIYILRNPVDRLESHMWPTTSRKDA